MRLLKFLVLLTFAAAYPALGQGDGGRGPVQVETVTVTPGELRSSVTAVGTLLAEASATLRTELPGQIQSIHFKEGQRLSKGDKLYSLEATVLEAEVNESRANTARSEAAFKRATDLYSKQLISSADFDTARANYDVDKARLLSSLAKLSKTVIRAPFDGVAGLRRINAGDYATVGQELVDVVQLDPLRVAFSLPETLLGRVRPDMAIEVTMDAYPGETFSGTVTAIAPASDVRGHNIELRASLPNPDFKLRPGLFVRIDVLLEVKPNAVMIPEEAIWPVGQDKTVYVVRDGKAEQRIVTLGERRPGAVEVLSGLEPGDTIITAGQMKIFDGAAVQSTPAVFD